MLDGAGQRRSGDNRGGRPLHDPARGRVRACRAETGSTLSFITAVRPAEGPVAENACGEDRLRARSAAPKYSRDIQETFKRHSRDIPETFQRGVGAPPAPPGGSAQQPPSCSERCLPNNTSLQQAAAPIEPALSIVGDGWMDGDEDAMAMHGHRCVGRSMQVDAILQPARGWVDTHPWVDIHPWRVLKCYQVQPHQAGLA